MKRLKTKIGISLTASCFFALSIIYPTSVWAPTFGSTFVNQSKHKPDLKIEKLVETLFAHPGYNSYALSDGRTVKFEFFGSLGDPYGALLEVEITKYTSMGDKKEIETLKIKDYGIDGLKGGLDEIFLDKAIRYTEKDIPIYLQLKNYPKFRDFDALSKESQERMKIEYMNIIEEAPKRILEKYHKTERAFEKEVLDLMVSESQS